MTDLATLVNLTQGTAAVWFVVFLRIGAAVMVMPGIGERSIPVRFRLILAFMLTLAVAASLPNIVIPGLTFAVLAQLVLAETVTGLFLGLGLRMFLFAMQTAGTIAAQSTSLAQISAGAFPDPLPAIGQLLSLAAVTLLMLTGFHVKAVAYLANSYAMFPVGQPPLPAALAEAGMTHVSTAFSLAFQLAAPFFLMSLIYNVTLGAINRAMPQLMVVFVGAPLITWGSLAMLFLITPMVLSVWFTQVEAFLIAPFGGR